MSNRRCFGVLMALFVVLFAVLAVSPREPATWAMENAVAVLFVIGLWATRRWFRFSRSAYLMMGPTTRPCMRSSVSVRTR